MQTDEKAQGFPLQWPLSQRRWTATHGVRVNGAWTYRGTLAKYHADLIDELRKLGAKEIVISSNVPLKRDGEMMFDTRSKVSDPGVAIYFKRDSKPYVMAMDRYDDVRHNVHALGLSIAALRTLERHGSSQLLEQALGGFKALAAAHGVQS